MKTDEEKNKKEAWKAFEEFPEWIKDELMKGHIHLEAYVKNPKDKYPYYSEENVVNVIKKLLNE